MSPHETIGFTNDLVFKFVFGAEKNKRILIALLNAILDLDGDDRITDLILLNPINLQEYIDDKYTTLDIKAQDAKGRRFNVEMQVYFDYDYLPRVIYYHDRLYTEQLAKGQDYAELNKTISISLLDFVLLENEEDLHNIYRYKNIKSGNELTDIKEIHFIELPKFRKDKTDDLRTKLEKWLHILKFDELFDYSLNNLPAELQEEEEIKMALHEKRKVITDTHLRNLIEAKEKFEHDWVSRINHAERKAMEKGMEKGIEKGIEKGKDLQKIDIVKRMLASGLDSDMIIKLTGISSDELSEIIKKLN